MWSTYRRADTSIVYSHAACEWYEVEKTKGEPTDQGLRVNKIGGSFFRRRQKQPAAEPLTHSSRACHTEAFSWAKELRDQAEL